MRLLGVDYGHRRIGLSYADELAIAVPLKAATQGTLDERLLHIGKFVRERRIEKFIVGYPYNMDGSAGEKAKEVDSFIATLKGRFGIPADIADERLTSFQAESELAALSGRHKKSVSARKKHRQSGEVDSRAAVIILQEYLDGGQV